jgi:hypothetical protein
MSRVITFDKGSKRRMKEIRWKLREVISAVCPFAHSFGSLRLACILGGVSLFGGTEDAPRTSKALTHNAHRRIVASRWERPKKFATDNALAPDAPGAQSKPLQSRMGEIAGSDLICLDPRCGRTGEAEAKRYSPPRPPQKPPSD